MTEKSLGSILLNKRLITPGQLEKALQKQRQQTGEFGWQLLGEILVEADLISRGDLVDALNKQAQLSSWADEPRSTTTRKPVQILNVQIDNMSMRDLLEQLKSGFVLTPNVDHLMKLQTDSEFYKIYTSADYRVCDSQVLMYASRFLGTPLQEKISGSDFFPAFCEFHKDNEAVTIFLLGGAEGVADRARHKINHKTGRNIVIGSHSPSFGFEHNEEECLEIIDLINQSGATVLGVGVGAPKQEKWIYKYRHKLPHVKIFLAVGATIDFEAGVIKRAPRWMSVLGIEWLFRICCDPKRLWKRYLVEDLPFFWLLLQQKLGLYTSPRFNLDLEKPANARVRRRRFRTASSRVATKV